MYNNKQNNQLKQKQQNQNNKQCEKYYVTTTTSSTNSVAMGKGNSYFPSTLSTGGGTITTATLGNNGCGGGCGCGNDIHGNISGGNHSTSSNDNCSSDSMGNILLPCHQHSMGPQKYQTVQFSGHLGNNERNNHLVVYHTATVHGL